MQPKRLKYQMRLEKVTLFWLACLVTEFCPGVCGLVRSTTPITVKVGREVNLEVTHLQVERVYHGESCKVEVDNSDPISQRVGRLYPSIFDCQFHVGTVKYIHSGSSMLAEDAIKLHVYKLTESVTHSETVYLRVHIVDTTTQVIYTRGLRPIVVSEINGLSNAIDSSAVRFRKSEQKNVSCTVSFSRLKNSWPLVGLMVIGQRRQIVDSVMKKCREFAFMNLHYQHMGSPTSSVDYLPLSVELNDPDANELVSERFFLPIYIKGALPNAPPHASFINMYLMDVDQFVLSTIIPGVISAEDSETPKSQLIFNISKALPEGEGYLVHLDHHSRPITSFLQADLDDHKIAFRPPTASYSHQRVYELQFVVHDSHHSSSAPIILHLAVQPTQVSAPRVAHVSELVLLEGQSRRLNEASLQIVDNDNGPEQLRVYVNGGLLHGRLTLRGRPAMIFSVYDLQRKRVFYEHDDSDSTDDRIELRINDAIHTILCTVPIKIFPKDDTPPYLVSNLGMQIRKRSTMNIHNGLLLAHDVDAPDEDIIYSITRSPSAGDIIRKIHAADFGTKVFGFQQKDLINGQIWYRHRNPTEFRDFFEFTLQDRRDLPNKSDRFQFHITVMSENEFPPELSPTASLLLRVLETDVGYISEDELLYTDVESSAEDLTFTITTAAHFVYDIDDVDAGRVVTSTHNYSVTDNLSNAHAAVKFTQADVKQMRVAFIPPKSDIGPEPRLVRIVFMVEDSSGNMLHGQTLDIEVLPVNNQVPRFVTSNLLVEEGGILGITTSKLSATDDDSLLSELVFIVDAPPRFGALQKSGRSIRQRDTFDLKDIRDKHIRYIHDGSDVLLDSFTLSLTDSLNQETKVLFVHIIPVDGESPQLSHKAKPLLIVSEDGEATVTQWMLSATDTDTDDQSVIFLVVRQPRYGMIQLKGQPATKFTQKEVTVGQVSYLHTSGEIGDRVMLDKISFIITDKNYLVPSDQIQYDLNVSITPINNKRPVVQVARQILVAEGEMYTLSEQTLNVVDPDTENVSLKLMITEQPQWGIINKGNNKVEPDDDISPNLVNSFTFGDILNRSVTYHQRNHRGTEPVQDRFTFFATDGELDSSAVTMLITIVPANDEPPDLMLKNFTINEGGEYIINQSMIDVIDLDIPEDKITFLISQQPANGKIFKIHHNRKWNTKSEVESFTLGELSNGLQLTYKHNGSETQSDTFALTVTDGKHEIKGVCTVTIRLYNDEKPEIVRNNGLEIGYGESAIISSIALEARDGDDLQNSIFYIILKGPDKGFLQYCSDPFSQNLLHNCSDLRAGENFTQGDINQNTIRYVHAYRLGEGNTDEVIFILSDGVHKQQEQRFEIRMNGKKQGKIALLSRGMTVREADRVAISTRNLSATDEVSNSEDIVFAVIKPPRLGQLEIIGSPFLSIHSFTQFDLAAQRVVYHHLTKNDFSKDSFTFTVTNGYDKAKHGEFYINILPIDLIRPKLVGNHLIEVVQDREKVISPYHLKAVDPDTAASNVTFLIEKPPTYGQLYVRGGRIASSFSQRDVELGYVHYKSDGTQAGLDNFLFSLSDGNHKGFLINGTIQRHPAMANIYIKPTLEDTPSLVTLQLPSSLVYFGRRRFGFRLNSRVLRAVDSDTSSDSLVYELVELPKHGHIENIFAKRFVRSRFTQQDLDNDNLLYIIEPRADVTKDGFTFTVEDIRGNKLNSQRFEVAWSRVEFEQPEMVACENIGKLAVVILRHGDVTGTSEVAIQVREISATIGDDFIPNTAKNIQFNPGESRVRWEITIRDENRNEKNEKVRMSLRDPVNTVLGVNRKMGLRIINAEDGYCPQYLGMMSKYNRNPPGDNAYLSNYGGVAGTQMLDRLISVSDRRSRYDLQLDNQNKPDGAEFDHSQTAFNSGISAVSGNRGQIKGEKNRLKLMDRNGKTRGSVRNHDEAENAHFSSTNLDSTNRNIKTSNIQDHKECSFVTKGLLHFDNFNYQLLYCNGESWQLWSPSSSNDGESSDGFCLSGWHAFNKRCYLPAKNRVSWEDAESACRSRGAHLTSVQSKDHLKWLSQLVGGKTYWIGLSDKENKNKWLYTSGSTATYGNWKSGYPKVGRHHHRKNCALVKSKLKWRNKHCNKYLARYVCELSTEESFTPSDWSLKTSAVASKSSRNSQNRRRTGRKRSRRRHRNLNDKIFQSH